VFQVKIFWVYFGPRKTPIRVYVFAGHLTRCAALSHCIHVIWNYFRKIFCALRYHLISLRSILSCYVYTKYLDAHNWMHHLQKPTIFAFQKTKNDGGNLSAYFTLNLFSPWIIGKYIIFCAGIGHWHFASGCINYSYFWSHVVFTSTKMILKEHCMIAWLFWLFFTAEWPVLSGCGFY
jgi:hypothetical protein